MTSYHDPGAQIIIVLRAVRVISRGVRGTVNFLRVLATGAGTASTWPDGGLVGHYMATIRQLGYLPMGRHPRSAVFGCGALADARRAGVDLTSCGPRSRSIRPLNCTLVLQLGSPCGRAALGVGCRGGRQCHSGLSLAS